VKIEYSQAPVIRCVARKDMPEYGLKEGQVFYCAKSDSLGDNQYHILTWNYENKRWDCPCKCGEGYNHEVACKHTKAASKDCGKAHAVQGYKPLSRAQKFALLRQKYDYRYQVSQDVERLQEQLQSAVNRQVAEIMSGERVVVAPLNGNRAFSILR